MEKQLVELIQIIGFSRYRLLLNDALATGIASAPPSRIQ